MISVKNPNNIAIKQIGNVDITTITWVGNHAICFLQRSSGCIIFFDYWAEGYSVIGTLPPQFSIKKTANSKTAEIQYTELSARIITVIGEGVTISTTPKI